MSTCWQCKHWRPFFWEPDEGECGRINDLIEINYSGSEYDYGPIIVTPRTFYCSGLVLLTKEELQARSLRLEEYERKSEQADLEKKKRQLQLWEDDVKRLKKELDIE